MIFNFSIRIPRQGAICYIIHGALIRASVALFVYCSFP